MAEQLFKTDGFRGPFDNSDAPGKVNAATFSRLAEAYADIVHDQGKLGIFILGSDTRESSEALRYSVHAGLSAAGAEVWDVGVAPTPVIAWLAQQHGANAVAITASHNEPTDNGIKLFDSGGVKAKPETLHAVEATYTAKPVRDNQEHEVRSELLDSYLHYTTYELGGPEVLANKVVAVDAANGAAWDLAPRLYKELGAYVVPFACTPKGYLINQTGATHLDKVAKNLQEYPGLVETKNFIGLFANDGDADRVLGVDAQGRKVDGNYWLKELAEGQRGIVGTVYTNSALRQAVNEMGVEFYECDNGDSHVTAMLQELTDRRGDGYTRGGEFTGHMIDLAHLSSGDGLYMGAWLAINLAARDMSLADLRDEMTLWPESQVNIQVNGDATAILDRSSVRDKLAAAREKVGNAGRIVLRASGTEPVIRLWAEAKEKAMVDAIIAELEPLLAA